MIHNYEEDDDVDESLFKEDEFDSFRHSSGNDGIKVDPNYHSSKPSTLWISTSRKTPTLQSIRNSR